MCLQLSKKFGQRCLTLSCCGPPEAILVFLHGLTENPYSYKNIFTMKNLSFLPEQSKIILPQSPRYHVRTYNNLLVPAWFDFWEGSKVNQDHVQSGALRICNILAKERRKHPNVPLFIGGFSQGAALCGKIAEQSPYVQGVFAFSGFMFRGLDKKKVNRPNWLITHGECDQLINQPKALKTFTKVLDNPTLNIIKGLGHTINKDGLDNARRVCQRWLKQYQS